jgi:hypothetical protein
MKNFIVILGLMFSFYSQTSLAAKFANQFSEFELPPQWQCILEGAEWVCQSQNEGTKKDAIIVLAAKLKGDQDSLDQYLAYLKGVKTFTSLQGKPIKSEPRYAKTINLNGQPWVDALHLESEIPGYYTRYLATVKKDIGILVTYSINKSKYQRYLADFENMVKTLKVFRKEGGINAAPPTADLFASAQVPQKVSGDTVFGGGNAQPVTPSEQKPKPAPTGNDDFTFYLILAAIAGVGFIVVKKRQGR